MDTLHILWTTESRDTFFRMVAMYAANSVNRGWWDRVNLIIWGASARLAGADQAVQAELCELIRARVNVEACRDCADGFGVSETLEKLGVCVRYMGEPLTGYLKAGERVLSV